ncbi:Ca-activated chloride channel family protein [Xanthobacter sp. SG618]|uniref:vWA domain-containing protein n=1 Tax=Xanthobacter sp. SG618 TaxID=2587121 RepID=UPI00145E3945|nr:VWA domain-containing protein [Xanthobacter sp. SG618]NMN58781.1 Ca-activated chloride channel family protein [Xanthobacter sp. SG618]
MITLAWPWMLALLPAPLLARFVVPRAREQKAGALRLPFFAALARAGLVTPARPAWSKTRLAALAFIWTLLVVAAAQPIYVGRPVEVPVEGREIMLVIDLSASMAQRDLALTKPMDRLQVVKQVADDFIARRAGDRVGLILFSTRAYVQAPLTLDRRVVRDLLAQATIGMTGRNTSIGDAIGLAVKTLRDGPAKERVVVLLTDGANTSGVLDPLQAAAIAAKEHLRIHTIGVGSDAGEFVPGAPMNPSSDLDEGALKAISGLTGGKYFRARDQQGLAGIYAEIDKLEPVAGDPQYVRPALTLFFWPLGAALVASFLFAAALLLRMPTRRAAEAPAPQDAPATDAPSLPVAEAR